MTANDWQPPRIMDDIRHSLDRVAATGLAMELNTSGANKLIAEMNPFPGMLVEMAERQIPVCIGADAHEPGRVADRFGEAIRLLESCGYAQVSFFLERKRHDVSIDARHHAPEIGPGAVGGEEQVDVIPLVGLVPKGGPVDAPDLLEVLEGGVCIERGERRVHVLPR